MRQIAFFPWLKIDSPIKVGNYTLLPFSLDDRSKHLEEEDFAAICSILRRYFVYEKRTVSKFTLLKIGSKVVRKKKNSNLMTKAFLLSEILSISAISKNEFFCQFGSYSNRDLFKLVFQQYRIPVTGFTIETHRKDGKTTSFVCIDAFREQRPLHVETNNPEIDEIFLKSLFAATQEDSKFSNKLIESIFLFNRACSDNPEIPEHFQAISLYSAIEKLCEMPPKGNVEPCFNKYFSPKKRLTKKNDNKKKTVGDLWITEYKALRGSIAHGHINSNIPLRWSLREHLLLGSLVFPLLVKKELLNKGLYHFTENDSLLLNVFEKLALCKPLTSKIGMTRWNEALSKAYWAYATENAKRKLKSLKYL